MTEAMKVYRETTLNPIKYFFGMLIKLPSVVFWGIKVKEIDMEKCVVTTKHGWTNQNPFKSMYFSALSGSAELSTGCLMQFYLSGRGNWSMLVTGFECEFKKKATGLITFTCAQGLELEQKLQEIESSTTKTGKILLKSIALNSKGEEVGSFKVDWSLKKK
jgi:hypothetical protein